jgi:hypothetical protein
MIRAGKGYSSPTKYSYRYAIHLYGLIVGYKMQKFLPRFLVES